MKLVTESYYRKSKLIFFGGLLWAITVPSCVVLWKKTTQEVGTSRSLSETYGRSGAGSAPNERLKSENHRHSSSGEP